MIPDNRQISEGKSFFESMLDNTFIRLQDMQVYYTIRRLRELDAVLAGLETELDGLLRELSPGEPRQTNACE